MTKEQQAPRPVVNLQAGEFLDCTQGSEAANYFTLRTLPSGWAHLEPRTPGDSPLAQGRLSRFEVPHPRLGAPSSPKAERSLPRARSWAGLPSPESQAKKAVWVENVGNEHFPGFLRPSGCVLLCEDAHCHGSHAATTDSCLGGVGFFGAKSHLHLGKPSAPKQRRCCPPPGALAGGNGSDEAPGGDSAPQCARTKEKPQIPKTREEKIPTEQRGAGSPGHHPAAGEPILLRFWSNQESFERGGGNIGKCGGSWVGNVELFTRDCAGKPRGSGAGWHPPCIPVFKGCAQTHPKKQQIPPFPDG
ncbi:uncharacterized protein LOC134524676 [Chroicocephalus ridibundus]|uniref:uncharacterized protein LOC134524676 n=1 Tax=Chroicocephalus ridibundus TaxID=1192867 RepID=UPI002FDC7EAF